jgi:hypothetical protein
MQMACLACSRTTSDIRLAARSAHDAIETSSCETDVGSDRRTMCA